MEFKIITFQFDFHIFIGILFGVDFTYSFLVDFKIRFQFRLYFVFNIGLVFNFFLVFILDFKFLCLL